MLFIEVYISLKGNSRPFVAKNKLKVIIPANQRKKHLIMHSSNQPL